MPTGDRDEVFLTNLTLEEVDADGAIADALGGMGVDTRAGLLRKAVLGSGALLAAVAAPAATAAARGKARDTAILNYGLTFEYLQSTFYTEAERLGTIRRMPERQERWARVLGAHERAHVQIIKKVLGPKAVKKPFFNFRGANETEDEFTRTAVAMEDLTVALLAGQMPRVSARELRAAFFSLFTVEARHAAWARRIVGFQPVGAPFDEPRTLGQVDRVVRSTRFIVSRPATSGKRRPPFTG